MNENNNEAPVLNPLVAASTEVGGCPPVVDGTEERWFVMRSSYCRELKAKELLERDGFQCYVPVHEERFERNGKIGMRLAAVVHNLVFVHTSRAVMDPWKRAHNEDAALRYMMDKSQGKPMVVQDKPMEDFIRVTKSATEGLTYLDDPDVAIRKGMKVEVVAGPFKGVQGHILRIKKDRRVVVTLQGILAIALATMPQDHFRLI